MLNMKTLIPTVFAATLLAAAPAHAHFQLVYTPDVTLDTAGDVPVKMIFWHPFDNGPVMDMAPPLEFYMIHRGEQTDLSASLTPITFRGAENSASGFDATVPVRRAGDYVTVTVTTPYFESSEDLYIQQFVTAFLSHSGVPTDWDEPLGLPAEIRPMVRPTNVLVGSTFTGQVLSGGEPVPHAEVEVTYIAAAPLMAENTVGPATVAPPVGGDVSILADANGVFTFGIPRAGVWGFAAIGVGPEETYEGEELEQTAVIWIRADELK